MGSRLNESDIYFKLFWNGAAPSDKYTVKRILKSSNRMIVFWADNTKTVVKRAEDEEDNDYAAFTAALACKLYGSNSAVKRTIKQKLEYQKKRGE